MRNSSEHILETKCCKLARSKGLAAFKLEKNGHTGVPDRLIVGSGGNVWFVEFKRPDGKGKATSEQLFFAEFLNPKHSFIDSEIQFINELTKRFP